MPSPPAAYTLSLRRSSDLLAHLAELPPALGRLIVRRLAEDAVGGLCGRAATRFDDVVALDPAGAALDVGDGARAVVQDGVLRFERTPVQPLREPVDGGPGSD